MNLQILENKIRNYLQNECNDFWNTTIVDNVIECYFAGEYRFSIVYDNEDLYISGTEIYLDMVYDIAVLLNKGE